MEDLVAPIGDVRFDIERDLDEQIGALPLPFSGMDKSGSATCVFHMRSVCHRGSMCPFRHIKPDRTVVCKHWLRGLCKKGDSCEFLHEYDMSKMPECYFYSKFRACSNKECPFLHIDPETKVKDCPWYDRGFCRHGPNCRHRHTRRVACLNYLCGFCPEGKDCKFVHISFEIPVHSNNAPDGQGMKKSTVVCHYCNEVGHKIYTCNQIPQEEKEMLLKINSEQQNHFSNDNRNQSSSYSHNVPTTHQYHHHHSNYQSSNHVNHNHHHNNNNNADTNQQHHQQNKPTNTYRPLDQVTCFKCGEKGHYANKCPKGYLAFLSPALKDLHMKRNAMNAQNQNQNVINQNNYSNDTDS